MTSGDKPDLSRFQQLLAERKKQQQAALEKVKADKHDTDLVPEDVYERTEADIELDRIVNSIPIIEAYNRWCGKSTPSPRPGQTESIKISCPVPGHLDAHPSAWVNTDKNVWHCPKCMEGGDQMDIAAYHFGYDVPGYKEGATYGELRERMALDFGYVRQKFPGGVSVLIPPDTDDESDGSKLPSDESDATEQNGQTAESSGTDTDGAVDVVTLYDDGDLPEIVLPSLDWKKLVPEDTFLSEYMKACTIDDVPEEFHFWSGLIALGLAVGRDVRLFDLSPIYANIFVCTLGRSGSGKSKARGHLDKLLIKALPYKHDDPNSKGARRVNTPASAEVMIHAFSKPIPDPMDLKRISHYASIRGMIDFNELSALVGRASRHGNAVIKPTMMQFYDMDRVVSTSSLTSGEKQAYEPFACALTTTQPLALRDLVTNSDDASGFLNRWLFVGGPSKKKFAIGGAVVDIGPAVAPLQSILGWASSFKATEMMQWSPEAYNRFTEFFHGTIEPVKNMSDNDLLVRMDLHMKKLVLLFAINRKEREASLQSVEDAIDCWEYLLRCYGIPAEQMGNTLENEITEAILYQMKRLGSKDGGATLNTIAKALKRRNYPKELLLRNLDSLVKLGFVDANVVNNVSRGRPTVRYKYVG